MRKGLTLALMTVAVASSSVQIRAMAPIISDIPSPIVGSLELVTGGGTFGSFVYLDAIDLDTMATDDVTAPSALLWTYTGSGTNGASNYLINGVAPINVGTVDPTSPTAAMIINRNDLDPVSGKDTFKNTITIRNKALSPLPMGSTGTTPGANGAGNVVPAQTQAVTFFCSDGNAFSQETVFFYTDNGGSDRLSGGDPVKPIMVDKITTMWATNEWTPGGTNQISRTQWAGSGVCLVGTLTGENYGSVVTPISYFSIAANQVYRIKMKMISSQVASANSPLWDILLENYDGTSNGLNLYIMDTFVFANTGAANAINSAGSSFIWYWAPPAVATAQWNAGAFTAANATKVNPRLRFRMMDMDSVVGAQGNLKSGSVCIQEVEVGSVSINRATVVQNLVNITSFALSTTTVAGNVVFSQFQGATATFSGGTVQINAPVLLSQQAETATLSPSTDATTVGVAGDPKNLDEYPIVWKDGKILRMQVVLSAPTAADEAHPFDALAFLFNMETNELINEQYQTASTGIGAPKLTPQTYTAFYYTGHETLSTVANYHRLRWQLRFMNTQTANFPNGELTNTGSVKVSSVKIDEVIFK